MTTDVIRAYARNNGKDQELDCYVKTGLARAKASAKSKIIGNFSNMFNLK
jgi:hypothetical protein